MDALRAVMIKKSTIARPTTAVAAPLDGPSNRALGSLCKTIVRIWWWLFDPPSRGKRPSSMTPKLSGGPGPEMTQPYNVEITDGVALVTLDAQPVNALGVALRRGLLAALEEAEANPIVREIVLLGTGRAFSAGADILEFGKPPQAPSLPDVLDRIEASPKPVIASLHGVALGGGLELAMAAHLLSLIHI